MNNALAAVVSLLPVKLQDKAKTVAFLLGGLVGTLTLFLPESRWLTIATLIATGLGVFAVPNLGYKDPTPTPAAPAAPPAPPAA